MRISNWFAKFSGVAVLSLAIGTAASAQYGGGMGGGSMGGGTGTGRGTGTYKAPSGGYGSGKAIGIGVGAAAAAVGTALFIHHRHVAAAKHTEAFLTGCTQSLQNGIGLTSEKDNQTYLLVDNGKSVNAGRRVMVRGVGSSNDSGNPSFQVRSVVKDYGSCQSPATAASTALAGANAGN